MLSAFISKTGSLSDVGLYNAGLAIVDGYVGMVFTAMATDYFPRLSGVIGDDSKWKQHFLQKISNKYGTNKILKKQNKDYILLGLPLYNNANEKEFSNSLNSVLELTD